MVRSLQVTLHGHDLFDPPLTLPRGLVSEIRMSVRTEVLDDTLIVRFGRRRAVTDHVRYWLERDPHGNWDLSPVGERTFCYRRSPIGIPVGVRAPDFDEEYDQSVVILLESPHYDEVSYHLRPKYPAAGKTGYNLHANRAQLTNMIIDVLGQAPQRRMPVILCNPVQYPASCRLKGIDDELRNAVFRAVWRHGNTKARFRERLRDYRPAIVIDACTYGLRPLIDTQIRTYLAGGAYSVHKYAWADGQLMRSQSFVGGRVGLQVVEVGHPSRWNANPDGA